MARYPSRECEVCSVLLEQKRIEKAARNKDGTFKYPVFELGYCSCISICPKGCILVTDGKRLEPISVVQRSGSNFEGD
jgi:hypothetical protein